MSETVGLFLGILVTTIIAAILMALGELASVDPPTDISDLPDLYRHMNPERYLELLDSLMDDASQAVLSKRQFCQMQRKRLLPVKEYLERLNHNAVLIFQIGWEAKFNEERKPEDQRNSKNLQCYQELAKAALALSLYAKGGLIRIGFWLWVRTHPWCPFRPPRVAALKKIGESDFVSCYARYKEAVGDYGLIFGREFQEALMLYL